MTTTKQEPLSEEELKHLERLADDAANRLRPRAASEIRRHRETIRKVREIADSYTFIQPLADILRLTEDKP
jgi:hypothetical protein